MASWLDLKSLAIWAPDLLLLFQGDVLASTFQFMTHEEADVNIWTTPTPVTMN